MNSEIITSPARVGEVFHFRYPDEPQFDEDLRVTAVDGDGPHDFVYFHDGTHSKQKNLHGVERSVGISAEPRAKAYDKAEREFVEALRDHLSGVEAFYRAAAVDLSSDDALFWVGRAISSVSVAKMHVETALNHIPEHPKEES